MNIETIKMAKQGDNESVLILFKEYEDFIHQTKKKFYSIPMVEKDSLVNLAMTKAIKYYDTENIKSKFFTFFYRVLYNEFKVYMRSQNTQKNDGETISFCELKDIYNVKYETDLIQLAEENTENVSILKCDIQSIIERNLNSITDKRFKQAIYDMIVNEYKLAEASRKHNIPKTTLFYKYKEIKENIKLEYLGGEHDR